MTTSPRGSVATWATHRQAIWSVVALTVALIVFAASYRWLAEFDAATKIDLRFGYAHADVIDPAWTNTSLAPASSLVPPLTDE